MADTYYDRVKETTTTTGTGSVTLGGAVSGYRTFLSTLGNGVATNYCIDDGAGNWEIGEGTLSGGNTLSRDTVLSSSNSNALVSFGAGTKAVFICLPAEHIITDMTVATNDGVSGSYTNPTTTPQLTLALGNITPAAVTAAGPVSIAIDDSATNATTVFGIHTHTSSGTAAAGFGMEYRWILESDLPTNRNAATQFITWAVATDATRRARQVFNIYDTAVREAFRIEASGVGPMIGFLGASASDRLVSPDVGTALNTFGLTSGTPTFAAANVTGQSLAITGNNGISVSGSPITTGNGTFTLGLGAITPTTVSASGQLSVSINDAVTNATSLFGLFTHNTTGTAAAGFGTQLRWILETDNGNNRNAASDEVTWADATDATRKSRRTFIVNDTSPREGFRIEASGSAPLIGFLGATAVVRQTGDVGTGLVNLGLFSGTPTFACANLTGTLAAAQFPALTGAVTTSAGSLATSFASDIPQAETVTLTNGTTATADTVFSIRHNSSGTPAAGFGSVTNWNLHSTTTTNRSAADETVTWVTATDASRKARKVFNIYDTAVREGLRIEASGSAPMIGFLGASASAQLASPDVGTALTTFGLASGTPTFSCANLTSTLLAAQFPALTGAVTTSAGSLATSFASDIPQAETVTLTNSTTNAADTVFSIRHNSSGTPAAGFGSVTNWNLHSTTTTNRSAADETVTWVVATDASRTARKVFNIYDTAVREGLRIEASGSAPMIGFLGANASARLASPDVGTALNTFGLTSGTPTFAAANVTGQSIAVSASNGITVSGSPITTGNGTFTLGLGNITPTSVSATGAGSFILTDAVTNTNSTVMTLGHASSGTPTTGFGGLLLFQLQSSTGLARNSGSIVSYWANATDASRQGGMIFYATGTAAMEFLRGLSGSAASIGFLGATPSTQLVSPDVGTALNTFGLTSGTCTVATANLTGTVTNAQLAGSIDLTTKVTGILPAADFPALTGDITTSAGALATTLKNTGTAGTYTKVTTDAQGRVSSGTTLASTDLPQQHNLILNSGAWLWQRQGTPATLTTYTNDTYFADRWYVLTQTAGIQCNRTTGNASPYALDLKQTQASAQRMGCAQIVENLDSYPFRSRTVRLQFQAKCSTTTTVRYAILEWTGTADSVTSNVVNNWTSTTYTASNFFIANITVTGISTASVGTGYTACSVTGTVSSSCNNLIVMIWTDGTAAQNVTMELSDLMLCDDALARDWLPQPYVMEELACLRFYEAMNGSMVVVSNVTGRFPSFFYKVRKRASPTVTLTLGGGTGATAGAGLDSFYQNASNSIDATFTATVDAEL